MSCWACALLGAVVSVHQCENERAAGTTAQSLRARLEAAKPAAAGTPPTVQDSSAPAAPKGAAGERIAAFQFGTLSYDEVKSIPAAELTPACWSASTGAPLDGAAGEPTGDPVATMARRGTPGGDQAGDAVCVGDVIKLSGLVHPRFGRVTRSISEKLFEVVVPYQFGRDAWGKYVSDLKMIDNRFRATGYSEARPEGRRIFRSWFSGVREFERLAEGLTLPVIPDRRKVAVSSVDDDNSHYRDGDLPYVQGFPGCREYTHQTFYIARGTPSMLLDPKDVSNFSGVYTECQYKRWNPRVRWQGGSARKQLEEVWKQLAIESADLFKRVCGFPYKTGRKLAVKKHGAWTEEEEHEFVTIIPPSYEKVTRAIVELPLQDLQSSSAEEMRLNEETRATIRKIRKQRSEQKIQAALVTKAKAPNESSANAARQPKQAPGALPGVVPRPALPRGAPPRRLPPLPRAPGVVESASGGSRKSRWALGGRSRWFSGGSRKVVPAVSHHPTEEAPDPKGTSTGKRFRAAGKKRPEENQAKGSEEDVNLKVKLLGTKITACEPKNQCYEIASDPDGGFKMKSSYGLDFIVSEVRPGTCPLTPEGDRETSAYHTTCVMLGKKDEPNVKFFVRKRATLTYEEDPQFWGADVNVV